MIPLVAPTITDRDREYLYGRSYGGLLEDETEVQRFEEQFAKRVGCQGAVAVCSGTVALELALQVLDVQVVSIPSYSCVALRNATRRNAVSYLDSSFHVESARMRLQPPATEWAVVAHMFGQSTTLWDGVAIEDYTLSLGGVPKFTGPIGVCSTYQSKMISTGRGGVVFSDDLHLLHEVRRLAYYETHTDEALSLGMSSTQAALGVSQLEQLDDFIERRRQIARFYSHEFVPAGIECPDPDCGSVFFRYMVGVDRDPGELVAELAEHGIEAGRGVYPPLHRLAGMDDKKFPGATWCVNHLLSVPCHPSLSDSEVEFIAGKVTEVCACQTAM